MPAYMLIYARIDDVDQFQVYANAVGPLIAEHQGKLIARGTPPDVLEGDWPWMTAGVLEFPSKAHAHGFWSSDAYTRVKKLRQGAAEFQALVVDAI